MDLRVVWQKPIQLTSNGEILFEGNDLPTEIEAKAGVYFFSRKHGKTYTPFYIGESTNLRKRLKDHLESRKIADVLRGIWADDQRIKQGTRFFHFAFFIARPGQRTSTSLSIIQRYMIRQAILAGIPVLNKQLVTYQTHNLIFDGSSAARGWLPKKGTAEA